MRIVLITPNYPSRRFIERGAFVEALVAQWQDTGAKVDVVAPVSWPNWLREFRYERYEGRIAGNRIARPLFPSFSTGRLGPFNLRELSNRFFAIAAQRALRRMAGADVYYGKFLLGGGVVAARAGMNANRPAFADLGESILLDSMSTTARAVAIEAVQNLNGLVCLSERLRNEAIELGAHPDRVLLAPNEPDRKRFRPLDRRKCRDVLSLPQDAFIVAFSGHFNERKGPLRVLRAIERLPKPAFGVFLGRGQQKPCGERVLHAGPIANDDIPTWLNAADIFVLPTLAEGSCNAIAEALACHLPVISSNIPDIRWQLPEGAGLLINPKDVNQLTAKLLQLMEKPHQLLAMRERLSELNRHEARRTRGAMILDWITAMSEEQGYSVR